MFHLPGVLSTVEVAALREALAVCPWAEGSASAGHQAAQVKRNRQLQLDTPAALRCAVRVQEALQAHPLFVSATLPSQVLTPLFNRYAAGEHYGSHVDGALQRDGQTRTLVRTDVSITLFLSEPQDYDGGELMVEAAGNVHGIKLPAGDAIAYAATHVHQVAPVTQGERWAACTWVQSMVPDIEQRRLLCELDLTILRLRDQYGDTAEVVALTQHYHNLLRQWARP